MLQEIAELIKENKLILFIGPRLLQEYTYDSWLERVSKTAERMKYNKIYKEGFGSNYQHSEFYDIYLGNEEYIAAMKKVLDISYTQVHKSKTYSLLKELNISTIYTTNYDSLIEHAFGIKNVTKIVDRTDFRRVVQDKKQILKYYGDFDFPETIITVDNSYYDKLTTEFALDYKLTSDIENNSILFLGFFASDKILKFLIFKLEELWNKQNKGIKQPKSYIFLNEPTLYSRFLSAHNVQLIDIEKSTKLDDWLNELLISSNPITPV